MAGSKGAPSPRCETLAHWKEPRPTSSPLPKRAAPKLAAPSLSCSFSILQWFCRKSMSSKCQKQGDKAPAETSTVGQACQRPGEAPVPEALQCCRCRASHQRLWVPGEPSKSHQDQLGCCSLPMNTHSSAHTIGSSFSPSSSKEQICYCRPTSGHSKPAAKVCMG